MTPYTASFSLNILAFREVLKYCRKMKGNQVKYSQGQNKIIQETIELQSILNRIPWLTFPRNSVHHLGNRTYVSANEKRTATYGPFYEHRMALPRMR